MICRLPGSGLVRQIAKVVDMVWTKARFLIVLNRSCFLKKKSNLLS